MYSNLHILGSCTYKKIRLYNNTKQTAVSDGGTLQICSSSYKWTAICDYNWGCNHAKVACKQLGFSNTRKNNFIVPSLIIFIQILTLTGPAYYVNNGSWPEFGFGPYSYCSSSYSSLFSCSSYSSSYRSNIGYCDPIRDTVSLQCSPSYGQKLKKLNLNASHNYHSLIINDMFI